MKVINKKNPAAPVASGLRSSLPSGRKTSKGIHLALAAALGLSLLGGFFFLNDGPQTERKETKEKIARTVNPATAEFVRLVAQIGDKDHEDVEKYKHPHSHSQSPSQNTEKSASVSGPQAPVAAATVTPTIEEKAPGISDDEERLRSLLSETTMRGVSDTVEGKFNEEQARIKQQFEERLAKFRHAQEEHARRVASLHVPKYSMRQLLGEAAKKVQPQNPEFGAFKGALTDCNLTRYHDVHWIDDKGTILSHVYRSDILTGTQLVARKIIRVNPFVVVIVYKKGYEVYDLEGNLMGTGATED